MVGNSYSREAQTPAESLKGSRISRVAIETLKDLTFSVPFRTGKSQPCLHKILRQAKHHM